MEKLKNLKNLASDKNVIFNWICAVLLIVFIVMQFMPYWHFTVNVPEYESQVDMNQFTKYIEEAKQAENETENPDSEAAAEQPAASEEQPVESDEAAAEAETKEVTCINCKAVLDMEAHQPSEENPYFECDNCHTYINAYMPEIRVKMKNVEISSYDEERSASINSYVWLPYEHSACDRSALSRPGLEDGKSGLENYFNKELKTTLNVNDIIVAPVFCLILAVLGIVFSFIKAKKMHAPVLTFFCGALGIWGYLTQPIFKLSESWTSHVVVCAILIVFALVTVAVRFIKIKKKAA